MKVQAVGFGITLVGIAVAGSGHGNVEQGFDSRTTTGAWIIVGGLGVIVAGAIVGMIDNSAPSRTGSSVAPPQYTHDELVHMKWDAKIFARAHECKQVLEIEARVKVFNRRFHDDEFMRDDEIATCFPR